MTSGLNYNLYNSLYHKRKSALYSYQANNYLDNCADNIKKIILAPRFVGLATCVLFLVAASSLPFLHHPILSYFITNTIALISADPAFIVTGALFRAGQHYSLLDKARVFGLTIMLMDDRVWGMKIAKCFVKNIKNLCAYTGYQFLSCSEYFKSLLSDFFKVEKENDEILDVIPEKEIFIPKNTAEKISMHQQHIDFYHAQLVDAISSSSKNIAVEGSKLLGITALMTLVLCAASGTHFVISNTVLRYHQTHVQDVPATLKGPAGIATKSNKIIDQAIGFKLCDVMQVIGFIASFYPLFSSEYIKTHCNGDVFSLKSINYHLLRYANEEIYDEFINQLGTGVILLLGHSWRIAYHAAARDKAKRDLGQDSEQKVANHLLGEGDEETLFNIQKDARPGLEENSQEISMHIPEEVVADQLLGEVEQII